MKNKVIPLIALVVAILTIAYYAVMFYRTRSGYEEMRAVCNSSHFATVEMNENDWKKLKTVRESWDLKREGSCSKEEKEMMRQLGYSADVAGLIRLWSDSMPPFSILDQEQNKLWILRATYRYIIFPRRMQYSYSDGLLFVSNDRFAEVYEDAKGDLKCTTYCPKRITGQNPPAHPAKNEPPTKDQPIAPR